MDLVVVNQLGGFFAGILSWTERCTPGFES